MIRNHFLAAALAAGLASGAFAADIPGSGDHPLVGRYEGASIGFHQVKGYEETLLPKEAIPAAARKDFSPHAASVAGKLTSIRYEGPADRSALEIVRNHQAALEADGFETVFFCRKEACGGAPGFWEAAKGDVAGIPAQWGSNTYLLARRAQGEGAVWASVFAVEQPATSTRPLTAYVALRVVEERPVETGKITLVKADALAEKISVDGRVALYGIEFDLDSDALREASAAQIAEIAAYLAANPSARVLVVGHTDATGAFDYNRDLSERRAGAVVARLTGAHGVSADRLFPVGVGPAAPVATNRTEDGRARNRRVEIVELPKAE